MGSSVCLHAISAWESLARLRSLPPTRGGHGANHSPPPRARSRISLLFHACPRAFAPSPRSPRRCLLSLPTLAPPHHHPPRLHRHQHAPSTSSFVPAPSSSFRFAHAAPVLPPCREATPTPQGHAEKEKARRVGMLPSPAATSCRRLAHPRSAAFTHPSTRLGDHTASPVHPETSNQQVCLPT